MYLQLPKIRIIIADGEKNEDVALKISDEGGGIARSGMDLPDLSISFYRLSISYINLLFFSFVILIYYIYFVRTTIYVSISIYRYS